MPSIKRPPPKPRPAVPPSAGAASADTKALEALTRVLSDKKVTTTEWATVAPALSGLPEGHAAHVRLLEAYADKQFSFDPSAGTEAAELLKRKGYAVTARSYEHGVESVPTTDVQLFREGNVAELDATFEKVMVAVGKTHGERVKIAVVDGGFVANDLLDDNVDAHSAAAAEGVAIGSAIGSFTPDERTEGQHHGTHVAGIATRGTSRIEGEFFAVPLPSKGEQEGTAPTPAPSTAHPMPVLEALEKAGARGASVVNVSIELFVTPDEIKKYAAVIEKHPNTLFVFGAGNDTYELGTAGPSEARTLAESLHLPNMTVVGASYGNGNRWNLSNYSKALVELSARGHAVVSASTDGGMVLESGTSMAAPNATNLFAKCRLIDETLTPLQARALLVATSKPNASWAGFNVSGGTIDADQAERAAGLRVLLRGGKTLAAAAKLLGIEPGEAESLAGLIKKIP